MEQVEEDACLACLDFMKQKHEEMYGFFAGPALDALDATLQVKYQELVSQPRDLVGIRMKVGQGMYATMEDFQADVVLCFDNSKLFCGAVKKFKIVGDAAKKLKDIFNKKYSAEEKSARKKVSSGKGGGQAGGRSGTRAGVAARLSMRGLEMTLLDTVVKQIRNEPGCVLLLHPVPKTAPFYTHYSMRITNPMDFDTLQANLMSTAGASGAKALGYGTTAQVEVTRQYDFVDEFVKDARRIFSNAIRYNCYLDKSSTALRKTVTSLLFKFEGRLLEWNKKNSPTDAIAPPLPPLKLCLSAVEEAFQTLTTNPDASKEVATSAVGAFIDPVGIQLDKETLKGYLNKVSNPMDYGTIVERVISGEYRKEQDLLDDVSLVTTNCATYWEGRDAEGGTIYKADAQAIEGRVKALVRSNPLQFGPMPELPKRVVADFSEDAPMLAPSHRMSLSRGRASEGGDGTGGRRKSGGGIKITLGKASGRKSSGQAQGRSDEFLPVPPAEPAPTGPPYRPSAMEKANYWLPLLPSTAHESENQLNRRAIKYLGAMVTGCLEETQKHYMKSEHGGKKGRVFTCAPFVKPVDVRAFPDYAVFLQNEGREEVNLQSMSRNLRADRYGTNVMGVLNDMTRLRDNAHAFNVGDANVETRILADCVYNYFRYLVRRCLVALQHSSDEGVKRKILQPSVMPVLDEPTTQDVVDYLKVVDEEHRAEWGVKQEADRKKREALRRQQEAAAAVIAEQLQREQEEYEELMAAEPKATYEDQLDWGIDLVDDPYGPPSGGGKGGGKGGKGAPQFIHQKSDWEVMASEILDKVKKHLFVDTSKQADKVIADFYIPVEQMFPQIAEQYRAVVKDPMDLTIISTQLNTGTLLDAEEFYEKLVLVFTNLVAYNSREGLQEHEKFAADQMAKKGSHLADYVKWLCLETLPVKSAEMESASDNPAMLGFLRESNVQAERKRREEILKQAPLTGSAADCKKLLAALKRTRGKPETIAMSWFCVAPVQPSDYAVYVRKPMDLGTVARRLDKGGSNSTQGGFMTYGEFLGDTRLTFQNSIKYNAVHLADEGSATVHKSAVGFLEKLEGLMPAWTIEVAEKCQREGITASNEEKRQREQFAKLLAEKESMEEFQQQEMQRRLAEDAAFREDMDIEKKKQRTLEEKKTADLEQALSGPDAFDRLEEEAAVVMGEAEEGGMGAFIGDGDAGAAGGATAAAVVPAFLEAVSNLRLQGVGFNGVVPTHLITTAQKKESLRRAVWQAWEPVRHHGTGHVLRDAAEDRDRDRSTSALREERGERDDAGAMSGPEQGNDGKRRRVAPQATSTADTPASPSRSGATSVASGPLKWVRVKARKEEDPAGLPSISSIDLSAGMEAEKPPDSKNKAIGAPKLFI